MIRKKLLEQKIDDLNLRIQEIEFFVEKFIRDQIKNNLNTKSVKKPELRLLDEEEIAEA